MPNKPKPKAQGIQLSYRYRIYPTPEQEKALAFEFDACRYVYNHFLRARTESWERTQETLRRPKLAPGADPNARHPEYVKDKNGKTVWEEYVNESYDPEAKSMGSTPSKMLTALKNSCLDEDGNLWLKQADSTALGYSTKNLDAAFDNFFRGRKKGQNIGYPRFKRRFDSAQSYKTQGGQLLGTYPDGSPAKLILKGMGKTPVPSPLPEDHPLRTVRWQNVYLPKIGKVRVKVHRIPEGTFVATAVARTASNKYYVAVNVKDAAPKPVPAGHGEVGITFGASHWVTTSDGEQIDLPERMARLQRRKAIAQRDLARKQKGSQNFKKQKRKEARVEEKIANIRKDATHKLTRELVDSYDVIASRNMGSSDMMQHKTEATKNLPRKVQRALNKKTADGNFFEFNRQLAYKSAWANRAFVEVPNDTPTAQVCSRCGHEELVLAKDLRPKWTCSECGAQHDRKANGAQNVLEAGKDILAKQEQSFVSKAKRSRTKKRAKQS